MANGTDVLAALSIGVDVSDRYSHVCVVDRDGEVIERGRIRTSMADFERYFRRHEPAQVTIEAGTHSPWMSRLLRGLGHDVTVANPRTVQLISKSDSKNDRNDAELLARLRRADARLLQPIEHRPEQAQLDMEWIRGRAALVNCRTTLVNHTRGVVKAHGGRVPGCSTATFADKARDHIPRGLRPQLEPVLRQIASLTKQIRAYDKRIEAVSEERYPSTAALRQVTGVGALTALCFVLTIDDPRRFKHSRSVGAYIGLRPRQDESGSSQPELRITKAGSPLLRRLLVQSSQYILGHFGPDSDLKRWGLKLAARGKKRAKKTAVIAVARKLAVLLHRLWVTGDVYEALRNANRGA